MIKRLQAGSFLIFHGFLHQMQYFIIQIYISPTCNMKPIIQFINLVARYEMQETHRAAKKMRDPVATQPLAFQSTQQEFFRLIHLILLPFSVFQALLSLSVSKPAPFGRQLAASLTGENKSH
jgi:hypothetical protein